MRCWKRLSAGKLVPKGSSGTGMSARSHAAYRGRLLSELFANLR
jgi:hypothetical protein